MASILEGPVADVTPTPTLPRPCQHCQRGAALPFELAMAFQPIVNVVTRETYAHEALVRGPQGQPAAWVFAQVTPDQLYAFDQACRVTAIRSATRLGLRGRLSINILPNAVYDPRTCIQATLRAAREANFPLGDLLFELTEHEPLQDIAHVRNIIDTYRASGFRTALDDYGAGHATAGLLVALRPDTVKIDMSIVRAVHQDAWRAALIRHLVGFAADTDVLLIAEGVETAPEARTLLTLGVTHMQGYFFAPPAFEALPPVPTAALDACHTPDATA